MKKLLSILLTLAVCSAALCVTAAAASVKDPAPTKVWGKVSAWEGEGIFLKNDDKEDPFQEVIIHAGEAPAVDAATGLPLKLDSVKEGDTLCAWIGPAAAMSLPPQVYPKVIVGNVPAGAPAPEYYELLSAGWKDPAGGKELVFSVLGGGEKDLSIPQDAEVTPWLTRQIVRLEDLQAGGQILVWRDAKDVVTKVIVFPYAYQGVGAWNTAGTGMVNGEAITVPGKVETDKETGKKQVYLPVRAMAEAAGYEVLWDKDRGAVVQDTNGELVFYVVPGKEELVTKDGEVSISGRCILENGVTYLPAEDLCMWLNLMFVTDAE